MYFAGQNFGAVQRAIDEVVAAVGVEGEVVHANAYGHGTPPMNGYMMAFDKVRPLQAWTCLLEVTLDHTPHVRSGKNGAV